MTRTYIPKMRKTPGRNVARVTLDGKIYYLGTYGSQAAQLKYDALVREWLDNGRRMPQDDPDELLVAELVEQYTYHAREHYGTEGRRNVPATIKLATDTLMDLFGEELAINFGPKRLKVLQRHWIEQGLARTTVNARVGWIKRIYKWATSEEIVPEEVHRALLTVEGIRRGYTSAKESEPVLPVSDTIVEQTLPLLPRTVAAMVLVQRYTGCRPGEVIKMNAAEIDRSGDVWLYKPTQHKTAKKGKARVIVIGPEAQVLIARFWKEEGYLFVPVRKKGPPCGPCYTNDSYRRAIHRACEKNDIPKWSPNQLRHQAATEIRNKFGIEFVQAALGHSSVKTSEIYAEHSLSRAHDVAAKLG